MFILLIFSLNIFVVISYSFSNPSCLNCKSYIPNGFNEDLGYCKIFSNYVYLNNENNKVLKYNYAKHCRDNEYLCGEKAILFEQIVPNSDNDYIDLMDKNTIRQIESNSNLFFNNLNKEEKEAYKFYCKNNLKNNLPRKYKKFFFSN